MANDYFQGYCALNLIMRVVGKTSIDMTRLFFLSLSFLIQNAVAQAIIVNPDGTHSLFFDNGSTSLLVNPDGTHTTTVNSGSTSVIVNPNGTHSLFFDNGSTSLLVNPDGTHTTIINSGSTSVIVNPDGRHSLFFDNGSTSLLVNPDGTHTTIANSGSTSVIVNPDGTHTLIPIHTSRVTPFFDSWKETEDETVKSDFPDKVKIKKDKVKKHRKVKSNPD
jgi:CDGSH-type Zn-finger protein